MSVTRDLLSNYQHVISEVRVVTGGQGVFDVVVDGQLLYSKSKTGRHVHDGEVLALFSELVGPGVARFGA